MYGGEGVIGCCVVVFFCSLLGTKTRCPVCKKEGIKLEIRKIEQHHSETNLRELPGSGLLNCKI